ncbi:MAG: hypothetical protein LBO72_08745, partial [Helicobacteraceae bacterium]|nr:hypothetical protein [Helicobacteraceae bacterium]
MTKWFNNAKQTQAQIQTAQLNADKLKALDGAKNKIVVRSVSNNEISEAQNEFAKIGVSVKFKNPADVKRTIDGYQIRHTLKEHGDPKTEAARGNIAVTYDDIANYTKIIDNHDLKSYSVSANGTPAIRYGKQINGYFVVVEEVRNKHHSFSFYTMYKHKGTLTPESLMTAAEKQGARGRPSSVRPTTTALLGRRDNVAPTETIPQQTPKPQETLIAKVDQALKRGDYDTAVSNPDLVRAELKKLTDDELKNE